MKYSLMILLLVCLNFNVKAQVDTVKNIAKSDTALTDTLSSSYNNIPTKKIYRVNSSESESNGKYVYKINDEIVSKRVYKKYEKTWKNMENCKPCILKSYDFNNRLISKGIQYTDCSVGYRIQYYPSGKVKFVGHFKENLTGKWNNLFKNGLCSIKDGSFTYFTEDGLKDYVEVWKNGVLINAIKF